MARVRGGGGEDGGGGGGEKDKYAGLVRLAQIVTLLVVFAGGVVIGLATSSHINVNNKLHFLSQPYQQYHYTIATSSSSSSYNNNNNSSNNSNDNANVVVNHVSSSSTADIHNNICNCTPATTNTTTIINNNNNNNNNEQAQEEEEARPMDVDVDMMESFLHPPSINHTFSDEELFWRASLVPKKHQYPYNRIPKVAFMFLTRGPLPLLPLWERFFQGHSNLFNIYIHAPPGYLLNVSDTSPFYARNIPSQAVSWGTITLADAEKRLLANALLDFSNERFVLLSESCIPVYNFPTVYRYLTDSAHSFVESYDDPSRYGRGRYSRNMLPHIQLKHWRKGSQWFELNRALAVYLVSDTQYYNLFRKYCKPACYPDEHYIPTYLNLLHGSLNSNRTVTWVDWSHLGPHPATYGRDNITVAFIQAIRNNGSLCRYNSDMTSICYLFARKFDPTALEPLLDIALQLMNY